MGVMRGSSQDLSGEQRMPGVHSARVFQVACAALLALALSAMPAAAVSYTHLTLPTTERV